MVVVLLLVVSQLLSLLNNIFICILFMSYISITQYTTAIAILSVHLSYVFILFIIKSYTKYMTDRHIVRTMKAVKAALNANTRQNIVYKIT